MEQITPNSAAAVRRMCLLTVLVASIGFALGSFLLTPLYISFASNVVYAEAWWVFILYYLTEEGLLDLAVFAVCYTAAIYAVWQGGLKKALRVPLAFVLLTLGRFVVNFFMTAITDSALPTLDKFLSFDLPYIGTLFLLEVLQYVLVIAIALVAKHRFARKREYLEACATLEGKEAAPAAPLLPFTRLLALRNPLQRSVFFMALLVALLRLGGHLIYQLTLLVETGRGDGSLVMILDLVSDLFIGVILYFVAMLLINRFYLKDTESAEA